MSVTSVGVTPSWSDRVATCSGVRSPSSMAPMFDLALRRLKNSFFCAAVVPSFTMLHDRRTYSWIEARIHHIA